MALYDFVGEPLARRRPGYIVAAARSVHTILIANSRTRFGFSLPLLCFAPLRNRPLLVGAFLSMSV